MERVGRRKGGGENDVILKHFKSGDTHPYWYDTVREDLREKTHSYPGYMKIQTALK